MEALPSVSIDHRSRSGTALHIPPHQQLLVGDGGAWKLIPGQDITTSGPHILSVPEAYRHVRPGRSRPASPLLTAVMVVRPAR